MTNDCTKRNKTFVLNPHAVLSSSNSLMRFGEDNKIVLPMAVLDQIQEQKRNGRLSFGKRKVAKDILEYVASFNMKALTKDGVIQENGSLLKIAIDHDEPTIKVRGISENDKRALQVAKDLSDAGETVIFITNNPVLRMKSELLGIKAEPFKDELYPSPAEQYMGRIDITVSQENMEKFYVKKRLEITDILDYEKYEWYTNMFVKMVSTTSGSALAKYDGEAIVPLCCKESLKSITPKNAGQHFLLEGLMSDVPIVIAKGSAGTGKTFCALAAGLNQLDTGKFKKILVTRPIQTVADEKIGFLPGDIDDKVGPYLAGIKDNLSMLSNPKQRRDADYFFNTKLIEIQPIGYIRGRTITETYFIIDETQNLDPEDIKSIVSRAGEGSKFVFLGDPSQVDNPKLDEKFNGLVYLSERMKGQALCYQLTLEENESVRGELAKLAIQLL